MTIRISQKGNEKNWSFPQHLNRTDTAQLITLRITNPGNYPIRVILLQENPIPWNQITLCPQVQIKPKSNYTWPRLLLPANRILTMEGDNPNLSVQFWIDSLTP